MKELEQLLRDKKAECISQSNYDKVKKHWDAVAKPLDSMGKFEGILAQIGAITETEVPEIDPMAVIVFAADNGIVNQGISQSTQEVTEICTRNIANGLTSVCVMAKRCNIEIQTVDIGVNAQIEEASLRNEKVRMGTRDFSIEPAMTREEALKAIEVGFRMAKENKEKGYKVVGVGEIGIGNTTTSSAVAAALLKKSGEEVAGRGAGLSDEGLQRKVQVINQAIERYELYRQDPLVILECVGGYDIAGMVGLYLGAAYYHIPVVLDGVISLVAALLAERLVEGVSAYLIPSHQSKEPVAGEIARELQMQPIIDAEMALGEGTGAVLMMSLIQTTYEVYGMGCEFHAVGIEQYQRF